MSPVPPPALPVLARDPHNPNPAYNPNCPWCEGKMQHDQVGFATYHPLAGHGTLAVGVFSYGPAEIEADRRAKMTAVQRAAGNAGDE